jgi:hypothetical protein
MYLPEPPVGKMLNASGAVTFAKIEVLVPSHVLPPATGIFTATQKVVLLDIEGVVYEEPSPSFELADCDVYQLIVPEGYVALEADKATLPVPQRLFPVEVSVINGFITVDKLLFEVIHVLFAPSLTIN